MVVDRLVNRATRQAADHRLGGDRPRGWPTAWSSWNSSTSTRTTRCASGVTPSGWPARTTTRWPWTSWSRGRSPSTRRSAPARSAPGWAPARRSTRSWWCPDGAASLAAGAIHPWSAGTTSEYFARLLQGLAEAMGFSMDTPWDKLPPHVRKAVLHGVERAGARHLPEPVQPAAVVLRRVRGRHPVPRAPCRADRLGLRPGEVRGLHAGGAVPGLSRAPGSSRRSWP